MNTPAARLVASLRSAPALALLLAAGLGIVPAAAQQPATAPARTSAPLVPLASRVASGNLVLPLSAGCASGLVYDDGSYGAGYSLGTGGPGSTARMVMRFDPPSGQDTLLRVCTCFSRTSDALDNMSFSVVAFDDDGPGGSPGTELGAVSATATAIPVFPEARFYDVDFAAGGLALPAGSVYLGARWAGGHVLLCGDATPSTPLRASYGSGGAPPWYDLQDLFGGEVPPRALGIRAEVASAAGGCVPSATRLCLAQGRFAVDATYATPDGASGTAQAVPMTVDTGYFWFFASTNVEAVVKVLDACGYNDRYWVFAGGLTNVRVTLTVTDTRTGAVKQYVNPQGKPFTPLQDTSAFATCP